MRGDDLVATGHTVHACLDLEGRVQRLPKALLERITAGEPAAEKAKA